MKISVITVSFNSERTIERTIKSVIEQTHKEIEYIIVDGGSTDNTLDIVDKYKENINILISEKDNGIYDAMNKGIKLATGEILHFLNSVIIISIVHLWKRYLTNLILILVLLLLL